MMRARAYCGGMICRYCRTDRHHICRDSEAHRGDTWCDCQHEPLDAQIAAAQALARTWERASRGCGSGRA